MNIFELWYKYSFIMSKWERMNVSTVNEFKVFFVWFIIIIVILFFTWLTVKIILKLKKKKDK